MPEATQIRGIGHSVRRKEDPRFIRGIGKYIDDVKLPGMLYMDIVRSPYAHARITRIDSSEALKVPGVAAVVTGKELEAAGLAWMPTLMSDTQMVLPTDHVVYQSQEVAVVVAETRYGAADAVTARHPRRFLAGVKDSRAQDPRHFTRYRWRIRWQGSGLSRLRVCGGGSADHRPSGEVDRGPQRKPAGGLVRARLPHSRRAGRRHEWQDAGVAHQDDRRPRCCRRGCQSVEVSGRTVPICTRPDGLPTADGQVDGGYPHQPAGGFGLPRLVRRHRAGPPLQPTVDSLGA